MNSVVQSFMLALSDKNFLDLVPENLRKCGCFVSALSGGADSLCLTLLLNAYAIENGKKMKAVIVNHKLRQESTKELYPIVNILKNFHIQHEINVWEHDEIAGNIEKKAREARYEILYKACKEFCSEIIFTAHHALDQWETFFMRLSRGSSLTGLSAMKKVTRYRDICICRPFLKISPDAIKNTLINRFKIFNFINDSSNFDEKFERVRWRKAYDNLSTNYNLPISSIIKSIDRLQNSENCLESISFSEYEKCFDGKILNIEYFKSTHKELRLRILRNVLRNISKNEYKIISYDLLERTEHAILSDNFLAMNLSGCILKKSKNNILVYKENRFLQRKKY